MFKSAIVALAMILSTANAFAAITYEPGIDRVGSDYSNFDLPTGANATSCMLPCLADARCKAYTYVRAGVQGVYPRCWLKTSVPPVTRSNCCTSGYKFNLR